MVNNIGTTTEIITREVGYIEQWDTSKLETITLISGELGPGFLLFDNDGTMSCVESIDFTEDGNAIYHFKVLSINVDIDVLNILSQSY